MPKADPQTLRACLDRSVLRAIPDTGLRFLDRRERATMLDWADVDRRAAQAAGALREAGVRPGDRVVIVLPTSPLFSDAFFGVLSAGAVPVPLYPPVRLGRLDEYYDKTAAMLQIVDARAVIADARVRRVLGQVISRWKPPLGVINAESLARSTAPPIRHAAVADELAMVQFSSGTTTDPKPVALTHRQVLANACAILDFMPHDQGQLHAGVSWLPLYHDMGLIGCIFPALHRTGPLTLIPPELFLAKPAVWLRAISKYRGTVSPAPDFAYAMCVERIKDADLDGCDLSSWRMALNGAEPISPRTMAAFTHRFAQWGLRKHALTPVYGLSEAALAVTFSDPDSHARVTAFARAPLTTGVAETTTADDPTATQLVSVGTPLRGFAVEIRGEGAGPLPDGRVGRIWASGPSLMRGYLGRDDSPIVDGWLDTGDQGFLHNGELYITGRLKDVVILRGRNHAAQDIERAVDAVAGVRTGCAAAVGDVGPDGEQLLLFVEARAPQPDTAELCRRQVLATTGLDAALVVVLEPGTLPRTSSGKIRRAEARRRWHAGELTPPDQVTPWMLAGVLARSAMGYLGARRK